MKVEAEMPNVIGARGDVRSPYFFVLNSYFIEGSEQKIHMDTVTDNFDIRYPIIF